jgi:hypothetical protein
MAPTGKYETFAINLIHVIHLQKDMQIKLFVYGNEMR